MATISSKSKFFSWGSKGGRQSTAQEPYYRTGGLLPIDTTVGVDNQLLALDDAKDTTWRRNPKNLSIVPPNYITSQSPDATYQNDAVVKSAPNLLAVFSDIFPSSGLSPTACIKSSDKPLPAPFSKYSLPPSPALPAELPGSILLDNQGYPATPPPEPDAESIPNSAITSVRSMYSLSAKPSPSKVPQHRKSANDLGQQRRSKSRPSLLASPSSTDSRITTCSTISNDNASSVNSTKARVGPETLLQPAQSTMEESSVRMFGKATSTW
ncbi:hypothetical protein N0V90_010355 [Kalmusia sp. IMI 367209]|nr:hypothetical protein N0V90_010355 [Kalmusia sp. IMI 367209]